MRRRLVLPAALILLVVGALAFGAFGSALEATNTLSFCSSSCHSMEIPTREYQESRHYNNISGVRATCADCHVPKALGPKLLAKIIAAKDLFHEITGKIDTAEKFEARRLDMANRVWRKMLATDSRECRSCHVESAMHLKKQDPTARKLHRESKLESKTCVECHKGVAHERPDEPEEMDIGYGVMNSNSAIRAAIAPYASEMTHQEVT